MFVHFQLYFLLLCFGFWSSHSCAHYEAPIVKYEFHGWNDQLMCLT